MENDQEEAYPGADADLIEIPDDFMDEVSLDNLEKDPKDEPKPKEDEVPADVEPEPAPPKNKKNDYQKRINKFSKETKLSNERASAAEVKRDLETERANQAEAALLKLRSETSTQRENELLEQRKIALKDGELEQVVELGDKLTKVHIDRANIPEPAAVQKQPERKEPDVEPLPQSTESWIDENGWYEDPKHSDLARSAERIERDLIQSGMGYGDALYKELDKRLSKNPGYAAVNQLGDEDPNKDKDLERPNHLASSERGGAQPTREKAGQLTEYDKRTMKNYRLDPLDPKVRAAYLKRKAGVR